MSNEITVVDNSCNITVVPPATTKIIVADAPHIDIIPVEDTPAYIQVDIPEITVIKDNVETVHITAVSPTETSLILLDTEAIEFWQQHIQDVAQDVNELRDKYIILKGLIQKNIADILALSDGHSGNLITLDARVIALETALANNQSKIDAITLLQSNVNTLQIQYDNMALSLQQLNDIQLIVNSLTTICTGLTDDVDDLQTDVSGIKTNYTSLNNTVQHLSNDLILTRTDITNLTATLNTLSLACTATQAKVTNILSDLIQIKLDIDANTLKATTNTNDITALTLDVNQNTADITQTKHTLQTLSGTVQTHTTKIQTVETILTSATQSISNNQDDIAEIQIKLHDYYIEYTALHIAVADLNDLQDRVTALEANQLDLDTILQQCQALDTLLHVTITDEINEVKLELDTKYDSLNGTLTAHSSLLEDYLTRITNNKNSLIAISQRLTVITTNLSTLTGNLNAFGSIIYQLRSDIALNKDGLRTTNLAITALNSTVTNNDRNISANAIAIDTMYTQATSYADGKIGALAAKTQEIRAEIVPAFNPVIIWDFIEDNGNWSGGTWAKPYLLISGSNRIQVTFEETVDGNICNVVSLCWKTTYEASQEWAGEVYYKSTTHSSWQLAGKFNHVYGEIDFVAGNIRCHWGNQQITGLQVYFASTGSYTLESIGIGYFSTAGSLAFVRNSVVAWVTEDEAYAHRLEEIEATLGENTAAISNEATTRATEDGTLASQITTLTIDFNKELGNLHGEITDEVLLRAEEDGIIGQRIDNLDIDYASADALLKAGIKNEVVAWIKADSTYVSYLDSIYASVTSYDNLTGRVDNIISGKIDITGVVYIGNGNSEIPQNVLTNLKSGIVNGVNIDTLNSDYALTKGRISQISTWGVNVTSMTGGEKYISGLQFLNVTSTGVTTQTTTHFVVQADNFRFYNTHDTINSNMTPIFQIGSDGVIELQNIRVRDNDGNVILQAGVPLNVEGMGDGEVYNALVNVLANGNAVGNSWTADLYEYFKPATSVYIKSLVTANLVTTNSWTGTAWIKNAHIVNLTVGTNKITNNAISSFRYTYRSYNQTSYTQQNSYSNLAGYTNTYIDSTYAGSMEYVVSLTISIRDDTGSNSYKMNLQIMEGYSVIHTVPLPVSPTSIDDTYETTWADVSYTFHYVKQYSAGGSQHHGNVQLQSTDSRLKVKLTYCDLTMKFFRK